MYKIFFAFFTILLLHISGVSSKNYTLNNEFDSVVSCAVHFFIKSSFWRPTLVLNEDENELENSKRFNKMIIEMLVEQNIPYFITNSANIWTLDPNKSTYVVVRYLEDCDTVPYLKSILKYIKYLFIVGNTSKSCRTRSQQVDTKIGEYDVIFMLKNSDEKVGLVTFNPKYDEETCELTVEKPKRINVCDNGTLTLNSTFPVKYPSHMNKCPLKVGMGSLYPLSIIENKESLKNYDRLYEARGMDVEIMKIVAEYLNATMFMYYIYKVEENPYVETNFLTFLLNGSLEICAGGIYRIYGDVVAYSGIYSLQTIIWVYTAERPEKSWFNLMGKLNGFYIFLLFYVTYSVTWYYISIFDKESVLLSNTLVYGWGALTGTTSLGKAVTMKQKILNISYLIMCLHLSAFISIILYSFLTIVGPPERFHTNEELMNSGRVPYLKQSSKYFTLDEKYIRFANTSKDCDSFYDCTQKSIKYKGITILIPGYFYDFQATSAVNDEARILRVTEGILTVYYEMIINKNSPLIPKFRKVIESLFEAGIAGRLFIEAIGINVVEKAMRTSSNMMTNSYSCQSGCSISMEQFNGVFYFWIIGCLISLCVFVIEIAMRRKIFVKVD